MREGLALPVSSISLNQYAVLRIRLQLKYGSAALLRNALPM